MNFLKTAPGAEPVIVEGLFAAPVDRLFRAWTDPDEIIEWFGRAPRCLVSAEIDLRVGGRWCFVLEETAEKTSKLEGEYIEIEPDQSLVFSWSHVTAFADGRREATHASRVSVTFTPHGKSTRIDLRHEAIEKEDGRLGVGKGWTLSFTSLEKLFVHINGSA